MMLRESSTIRKTLAILMLASAGLHSPVMAAEDVTDCFDTVLTMCADAMEGARWWERFALGVICSGMLAGCVPDAVIG